MRSWFGVSVGKVQEMIQKLMVQGVSAVPDREAQHRKRQFIQCEIAQQI
jgi:hypothetical protein